MANSHFEIYKERYETFRHLDKLRWQMLQIAVAAPSVILVFGGDGANQPKRWAIVAVGAILIALGVSMLRIGSGIRANNKALYNAGKAVGDNDIPVPKSNTRSVSFWIAITVILVGASSIIWSLCASL